MVEPISNTELDISSLSDIVDLESTQNDIESSMSESSSWDVSSSELPQSFVSLLSRLCSPKPLDLSQKRKVTKNLPPLGKKKGKVLLLPISRVIHLLNGQDVFQ